MIKFNSGRFQKGKNHPNFAKHLSKKIKDNISFGNRGKSLSLKIRKKISKTLLNNHKIPKSCLKFNEKKILNLYLNKKISVRNIAKLFGRDKETIYTVLKRNNIKINKFGSNIDKQQKQNFINFTKQRCSGKTYEEMYGKDKSEDIKKRLSLKLSGKNNHQWRGGKSIEPYTIDFNEIFKKAVKSRDNFRCLKCNIFEDDAKKLYGRRLCVHHIDYNKKNSIYENCCSLCVKCHGETTINRKQWRLFFQSLLKDKYNYKYKHIKTFIITPSILGGRTFGAR